MTEKELQRKRQDKAVRRKKRKKELAVKLRKMSPEDLEIYRIEREIEGYRSMQIGMTGWNALITRGEEIGNAEDVRKISE
jgi:hypothetical protein